MNEDEYDLEGIEISPDIKDVIAAWLADVNGQCEHKSRHKSEKSPLNSQIQTSLL